MNKYEYTKLKKHVIFEFLRARVHCHDTKNACLPNRRLTFSQIVFARYFLGQQLPQQSKQRDGQSFFQR